MFRMAPDLKTGRRSSIESFGVTLEVRSAVPSRFRSVWPAIGRKAGLSRRLLTFRRFHTSNEPPEQLNESLRFILAEQPVDLILQRTDLARQLSVDSFPFAGHRDTYGPSIKRMGGAPDEVPLLQQQKHSPDRVWVGRGAMNQILLNKAVISFEESQENKLVGSDSELREHEISLSMHEAIRGTQPHRYVVSSTHRSCSVLFTYTY